MSNPENAKPIKTLKGHTDAIESVQWNPTGELIASGSSDKTVRIWNLENDLPIAK